MSVMDVIIAVDGSVLEPGLKFGQPRLRCGSADSCASISVAKCFRIFCSRNNMISVQAKVAQEQAWLKRFSDLAKPRVAPL